MSKGGDQVSKPRRRRPIQPRYAGEYSKVFWRRVNSMDSAGNGIWMAACMLQQAESQVLRWLHNEELASGLLDVRKRK